MASKFQVPTGWSLARICDVADVILSNVDKVISPDEVPVRLCNYTDVYYNRYIDATLPLSKGTATEREIKRFQLRVGDVIITKDSEDRHDIAVPTLVVADLSNVLCGYHLAIIRPHKNALDGAFLATLLQSHLTRHYFSCLANGVTRFGLTSASIEHARILLPEMSEQKRIGAVTRACDDAIKDTERLVDRKENLRRGLMQKLVLGKKRLPGCTGRWRSCRIGDLLQAVSRHVTLKDDKQYRLVSIRRRSGGLFDREVRYGRDIGYTKLMTIQAGDFLIARRQVLHGAMAMVSLEFEGAYVSNAYAALVPRAKASVHMPFFDYLSQTPLLYYKAFRCSYGVAIEKMFFNLDWFLREEVTIPPTVEEQERIASVLEAADREIDLLKRELRLLRKQKRGLIQKLLTGQKWVKV